MTPLFRKFLSMNWLLTASLAGLLTFGVYSIYSAGFGESEFGTKWNEQLRFILAGATIYFAIALFDYRWVRWIALPAWIGSIVLLSMTNVEPGRAAPPLAEFAPGRYRGPDLRAEALDGPHDKFSVSTFGHGTHACPGRTFALMVIKLVVCRYLTELDLTPTFTAPKVPPASVGAVARSESECVVEFAAVERAA